MKKKQITATQGYFTDYREMEFKLTAHRLDSENRNTVLWNKNYRNTAPKMTQYRNTANPYAPLLNEFLYYFLEEVINWILRLVVTIELMSSGKDA